MSYRVRYTMPDGRTGRWMRDYATREDAQRAIGGRVYDTGFAYFVEEWPDVSTAAVPDASPDPTASQWPGQPAQKSTSTTERLVGLLRDRHARGLAKYGTTLDREDLTTEHWAQHAIEEALDLAGYLMRLKDSLAASRQGAAKASEAPGEGGDSGRRRLEALERFIKGSKYCESLIWQGNAFWAISEIVAIEAPTLAALANKLMEKEDKP